MKKNMVSKSKCKFPFKYKGKLYNNCLDIRYGVWYPISLTKRNYTKRNYTKRKAYCIKKSRKSRKSKHSKTKKQLNNLLKRNKSKSKYVSNEILEPIIIPKKSLNLSRFLI